MHQKKLMFWATYFITVVYLQLFNIIAAHAFFNLFFAIFVFFPVSEKLKHKVLIEKIRNIIAIILGLVLLWHESYLPSFWVFWNFLVSPELRPSWSFVFRFILSVINLKVLIAIILSLAAAYFLSYTKLKKYFFLFFVVCFLIIGFTEKKLTQNDLLGNFYQDEQAKIVNFSNINNNDYDIVVLQLCSFAWADFKYSDFDMKPFLKQFDYIFTDFNSVASYSNPAVLRLLRSTCGQVSQGDLFVTANNSCYLIDNLKNLGYSTYTSINHDGVYSGFTDTIIDTGRADKPLDNSQLTPAEISFDNSPIYDDLDALNLWREARKKDNRQNSFLFYNSITLHTGSKYVDSSYLSSVDQYNESLSRLTQDLDSFFVELKKSDKKTIVIILGEHGAALQGSVMQPGTVREIPLPDITQVPVVVKFFGPDFNTKNEGQGVIIDKPTSYFGLATLLSELLRLNPSSRENLTSNQLINNIPETPLVSENQNGIVLQNNQGLYYKLNKYTTWDKLDDSLRVKASDYLVK